MNNRKVIGTYMSGQPIYALDGRGSAAANRMLRHRDTTPEERIEYHRDRLERIEQQVQTQREVLLKVQNRLHFKWQLTAAKKSVEFWSNKADEARADLERVMNNTGAGWMRVEPVAVDESEIFAD